MKEVKRIAAVIVKSAAQKALVRDANRTTCHIIFQPKVPTGLNRFKKNKA